MINTKYPPFGKALAERIKFNNTPFLVRVCVGLESWEAAKKWNDISDNAAMVLPAGKNPSDYKWPVTGCTCVIEWAIGPNEELIINLVKCLLIAGADTVTVRPLFVDMDEPSILYDITKPLDQRWVKVREELKVYSQPAREVSHAA